MLLAHPFYVININVARTKHEHRLRGHMIKAPHTALAGELATEYMEEYITPQNIRNKYAGVRDTTEEEYGQT